jgi:TolB protein
VVPDGTVVSFTRLGDIWVMNPDGSNQINVTNSTDSEFLAHWSPDGSQLAFVREVPGQVISTQFDIFTMSVDGTNQVNITNSDTDELEPAWSPVGTALHLPRYETGTGKLSILTPRGAARSPSPLRPRRIAHRNGRPPVRSSCG